MKSVLLLACAALLASAEEPAAADLSTAERLAQLKKLAEFKRAQDAAKLTPPKLDDGDVLMTGRVGVNQLVNGHFKLKGQQFHGRPSYEKLKAVESGPEAIDLAMWWSSGKWYVGLLTEIGTDAAYAFVPSQAMLPEAANSIWSIWDGSKWLADTNMKCTGTGNRKLHVGDVNSHRQEDDDDDYQEYLDQKEREEADYEDDEEPMVKKPYDPEAPEPVEGKAPKRLKFKPTCPEGHPGCSPHNMCKVCPAECQTCQNIRYANGHHGTCGVQDCFSCEAGYKHVPRHGDGRGQCMSAGSGNTAYITIGVVAVALVGIIIYFFLKQSGPGPARKRGLLD